MSHASGFSLNCNEISGEEVDGGRACNLPDSGWLELVFAVVEAVSLATARSRVCMAYLFAVTAVEGLDSGVQLLY